jgi:hypothetical protein
MPTKNQGTDSDPGDKPAKEGEVVDTEASEPKEVSKNKKYRKPKPWDHDGIEHWKVGCQRSSPFSFEFRI